MQDNNYTAEQIQVLEGLEAVRKRPGMYIGSTSARGLHHLVYEIVDNAIDEALAGYCNNIWVTIEQGNVIVVEDDGRGIPVDIQQQTGLPAVEVVFTILHAGGKFGGSGYKVSGGLHGVGASVVNALSEYLEVEVFQNGNVYFQRYERGNRVAPLAVTGKTDKVGSRITFLPDSEIFDEVEFDFDTLLTRLREQAFLNGGVKIILADRREGREQEVCLHYEGGIVSFVEYINAKKSAEVLHEPIYVSVKKQTCEAEIALQYNDSYNEIILSFANNINTTEGGMHETGFKSGQQYVTERSTRT